ncbi:MAG TPA: PorV/PorQ family protein [Balneolales bacterium]|nr:PorV/PorQ family protein [Balneolales bacterium]
MKLFPKYGKYTILRSERFRFYPPKKLFRILWISGITFALGIIFSPSITKAQNGGYAGAYTRMGFGPRGMAMGNAMTSVDDEGIYAHYNPALAAGVQSTQFDVSVAAMSFNRSLNSLNASFRLPPQAGINVGLLNAGVGSIDGRSNSGYHTNYFSTQQFQLFADFGIKVSPKLQLGAGIKFNYADFHKEVSPATGTGFDLGMLFKPVNNLNIGFAIQDLLASYTWDTQKLYGTSGSLQTKDQFPTRIKIGASYRFFHKKLILASDYELRLQHSDAYSTVIVTLNGAPYTGTGDHTVTTRSNLWRCGASYRFDKRFTLRAGWQVNDLRHTGESNIPSAGFSVHLPFDRFSPSIDYAFLREPDGVADMHVFSIHLVL